MPLNPTPIASRPLQFKGSTLARWMLRQLGWRLHFEGLPGLQGVIVVYPHTSNLDFPIGVLAKWAMGIPAHFWGKDSLFKVPLFGAWLRWLGGIPVNRSAPGGLVEQTVQHLRASREAQTYTWLVVAPEGTRKRTEGWRSGFYRVAVQAGVPVGLATIDFATRQIHLNQFVELSGEPAADMAAIADLMGRPQGYRPDNASPIRLT